MECIKGAVRLSDRIRVRFAPSPTGYLHIGGARTALFNWLFARHYGGTFILRIEDTDRSRSTGEFIEAIIEGMQWLGLHWDEGPFRQTDRLDIYRKNVEKLLNEGRAYYCYCSAEELEKRRREALAKGIPPRYDGRCRNIEGGERRDERRGKKPAVRFKMPQEGEVIVDDLIRGRIVFENAQLDDLIIMRSDGTPTYNFVVVVDDIDMKITHVIRGDDHLNNTPKQIHIYRAFNVEPPFFAHLPMILGPDKARLSKRHGATSVNTYREEGYLPDALINYLARLGWSYGDQEVFSRDELIEKFSLENVGSSPAVFNPEKLLWINSQHINNLSPERLSEAVVPFLIKNGILMEGQEIDKTWLCRAIAPLKERSRTLIELSSSLKYYISEYVEIDPLAKEEFLNEKVTPYLIELRDALILLEDFVSSEIEKVFMSIVKRHNLKLGDLAQPVRVAITGTTVSPGIFDVLEIVGKEKTIKRLKRAINGITR